MKYHWLLPVMLAVLAVSSHSVQSATSVPCGSPEYRQFDFWLGEWDVNSPTLGHVGMNHLTSVLNGCAVLEEWTGANGSSGKGLISYSSNDGKWREHYLDDQGGREELLGGLSKGVMALAFVGSPNDGRSQRRIRWRVINANELQQIQETSTDGGEHWTTVFEGTYSRKN